MQKQEKTQNAGLMEEESFCRHLAKILHIPFYKYTENGELIWSMGEHPQQALTLLEGEARTFENSERSAELLNVSEDIYAAVVRTKENDMLVIGPVYFARDFWEAGKNKDAYFINLITFVEGISMLSEFFTGKEVELTEFVSEKMTQADFDSLMDEGLTKSYFQQQENGWRHNSYEQEKREQEAIKTGDVEKLKQAIGEPVIGKLGKLAKNEIRSAKNVAIGLLNLSVRSAIQGGLDPEEAFTLCDNYSLHIEEMTTLVEITKFTRRAQFNLATMVAAEADKKRKHPLIENVKKYIYQNMHGRIRVDEMAEELHVNPNYLSGLFKEYEGITLTEYIMKRKVHYAKNLLVYSNYSYDEIAYYFGFSSRSRFGAVFKKVTGVTPKQYREQNQDKNFVESTQ